MEKYIVIFYNDKIIETTFIPKGQKNIEESHAVILNPKKTQITFTASKNQSNFLSKGISVHIQHQPFKISYQYKSKIISSEKLGYQACDNSSKNEKIQFNLTPSEVLYGGGARVLGMNRRGNRLELYNRAHYGYENSFKIDELYNAYCFIPQKKYMIHFDNAPIGFLDLDSKKNNTLTYETISGKKTYQIITGDSWKDIMSNYTLLTGRQPLPPIWTLGNFTSRFGYHSEKQAREVVSLFQRDSIPLDAIIFDLYWFGKEMKGTMGNFEFLIDSFPQPKKMMKDFKQKGIKTVLVTEPFILNSSKKYNQAITADVLAKNKNGKPYTYDFYFGHTGLVDVFKPKAQQWFWQLYKNLIQMGVDGFWGDLGEPEVHPSDLIHATGTADEVHNIYGHQWAKILYEGYQKYDDKKRPFILMRSGYSGSQRFGLIPWSGDVNRTWGGLQAQSEISLQMGMQGIAYMHSDLGGFAGDLDDGELYTRWLQYGVFQPVFRPHAQESVASEPIYKNATIKKIVKKAIELRYRMLPYNYTLAFENNQTGMPLMRPLFFEEPANKKLWNNATSYLWGDAFLITPIVNANATTKDIYFPKNKGGWFDFYSNKKYDAENIYTVKVNKEYIPTFVKAGAFIPMINVIQSTKEYQLHRFHLHYYHHKMKKQSKGKLYHDDGSTANAYQKKQYEQFEFSANYKNNTLQISIEKQIGENFKSFENNVLLSVHNINKPPKKVMLQGEKIDFIWSSSQKKLEIKTTLNTNKTIFKIEI